jgi:methylthioribulose-1-phosphate dehydratase
VTVSHRNRYSNGLGQTAVGGEECSFLDTASILAEIGAGFYLRGWVLGTGGNFSSVLSSDPFRLAITPTGSHKGQLSPGDILEINEAGEVLTGSSRPSFEYMLHLAIIRARGAGAVLHTHSIWATILSGWWAQQRGFAIEGYEMLKGLEGVSDHRHREWLPILPNSQDMIQLGATVEAMLEENPDVHGFILERHGLYTWGPTLSIARRHVEILEFLLEVVGRTDG